MVSVRFASELLNEARGQLLTLLQSNDTEGGFATSEWSDEIFQATECLKAAQKHLDHAELYG